MSAAAGRPVSRFGTGLQFVRGRFTQSRRIAASLRELSLTALAGAPIAVVPAQAQPPESEPVPVVEQSAQQQAQPQGQAQRQQGQQPQQQPQQQQAQAEQEQAQPPQQAQQQPQAEQQPQQAQQQQAEQQPPQAQQQPQGQVEQPQEIAQSDAQQPASGEGCANLPDHGRLSEQLRTVVSPGDPSANGGLGNPMWAVLVDRYGTVCAVTRTGESVEDQWLGSRAIAAGKAFTANAFSLPSFALSTANLYWPTQPESSLYDLGLGNPFNPLALYGGDATSWGTADDPLSGRRIGGTIVFGGGLALYTAEGQLVGALGISGDESCTDHVVAWKVRHGLNLDNVPDGPARDGTDNIIHDLTVHPASGQRKSSSGYGHPVCSPAAQMIAERFTETAPAGPRE